MANVSDLPIINRLCTRASEIRDTNPDNWLLLDAAEIIRDLLTNLTAYVEQEEQAAPYSSSPMREAARAVIHKVETLDRTMLGTRTTD